MVPRFIDISPVLKSLNRLKLINAYNAKFSQSPTNHFNLTTPPISTIFCNSLLCYCHFHTPHGLLSIQNNRQIIHSSCTCSLERSSKRYTSISRSFFSSEPIRLYCFFFVPSCSIRISIFTLNHKLFFSNNHFLFRLIHTMTSFCDSWTGFRTSIAYSFSLFSSTIISRHLHYMGISLHQFQVAWLPFAGTLNLLTHFTYHRLLTCT